MVAPLVAAEADTSLQTVREKVEAAFGRFPLADTPMPQEEGAEEQAVTILNEGVRSRRLVEITYLSRSSDELSTRTIEPYLLRRDDRGWYVEAYDRTPRRPAHVQGLLHQGGAASPTAATSRAPRWAISTTRSAATWASPGCGSRPSGRAGSSRAGPARGRSRTAPRWPT